MENQQPNQPYQPQAPQYAQPQQAPQYAQPGRAQQYAQPQQAPVQQAPAQQQYIPPQGPVPQVATPKPKKGWGKLIIALLCVPLFIVGEVIGIFAADALSLDDVGLNLLAEAGGAIFVMVPCLILGGTKLLNITKDSWKIAWKALWWSIAISAAIAIYDLYCYIDADELVLVPDWPWQVFLSFIFCLFIGFFEEFMARGLVLNGLLARMGTNRKGVVWACILTSLFFGLLHVDITRIGDVTMLEFAQGVLKVVQTGMYGFALAAVVCKTGELVSASLLHALDDWLLFILTFAMGESLETEYVAAGTEEGIATVIVYLICIALYIPLVVKAVKTLKGLDVPCRGAFFKERAGVVQTPVAPTVAAAPAGYAAPQTYAAPQGYPVQQAYAPQQQPVAPQGYPVQQAPVQQSYIPPQAPVQQAPVQPVPSTLPENSLFQTGRTGSQGEQIPPAR